MWEAASLIDFSADPQWMTVWERGDAQIFQASPRGVEVNQDSDGTRLAMTSSLGVEYDPQFHLYLGRVPRASLINPFPGSRRLRSSGTMPSACVEADWVPVFASMAEGDRSLREVMTVLPEAEVELAVRAVALVQYHTSHPYCSQCGHLTSMGDLGRTRLCGSCGTVHFPRTDPAVIVAITDEDDCLLLGHHEGWERSRYSVFAGFVEAGESLEQALCREVMEEVDVNVSDIRYQGSQPWPMPRSLMLGFTATAFREDPCPDGEEITSARWFSREELRAAIENGEVVLPVSASIAYRLITAWYGEPLPS